MLNTKERRWRTVNYVEVDIFDSSTAILLPYPP